MRQLRKPIKKDIKQIISETKLQAARLRVFGNEQEQKRASMLFSLAADDELYILSLSENPSEDECAMARIEACGLYIDAKDFIKAKEQLNKIPKKYIEQNEEFQNLLIKSKLLKNK